MSLSPRLESIASLVKEGSSIADIGSDHGALPIFLVKTKKIRKALAVENKIGPFSRLKKEVEKADEQGNIELSLSSGISYLPSYVDSVVISGMGGGLTARILKEGQKNLGNVSFIIVEPQGEKEETLEALFALGYHPVKEICLYEGEHYYESFLFSKGKVTTPELKCLRLGTLGELQGEESYIRHTKEESLRLKVIMEENTLPNDIKARYQADIKEMDKILNEH